MRKVRNTRVWVSFALVLLFACVAVGAANAGLFGLVSKTKTKQAAKPVQTKVGSLIIFPFDLSEGVKLPETMGADLASAFRSMLGGNGKYAPILYKETLAPIVRAREGLPPVSEEDTLKPFAEDRAKPLMLTRLLAGDYYVAGAVEDVQMDSTKKIAQMTLALELVEAKTGRLVKVLMVNGKTPEGSNATSEDDAVALAAGDAVTKLKAQLLEDSKAPANGASAPRVDATPVDQAPAKPSSGVSSKPPTGGSLEPSAPKPPAVAPAPGTPRTPGGPGRTTPPGGPGRTTPPVGPGAVKPAPAK